MSRFGIGVGILSLLGATALVAAPDPATAAGAAGAIDGSAQEETRAQRPRTEPDRQGQDQTRQCGSGTYQAEVFLDETGAWTATNGGEPVYSGDAMIEAMRQAVDSLSPGRTEPEAVLVRDSGSIPADASVDLPSFTTFESCGTIDVIGEPGGDHAVIRARGVERISVPHLSVTGAPYFGVFVRNASDVHLGNINLELSGGLGIRIDNHDDTSVPTSDVTIDSVFVSGTNNHGVETYGVDGLTIGTVTARDTAYSGLLLNDTTNATIGTVDAEGTGTGTGYAAFRMANRNGRVGDDYPTNIEVDQVIARGGGRGVFCVSESGGAVINRVDIADTGNNAILIENCYNVTIAAESGTVAGPGDIRLAARDEFANNRDITLRNLTVTGSAIVENPCGENITIENNELIDSELDVC